MTNILEDYPQDIEMQTLVSGLEGCQGITGLTVPQALECMTTWPLIQRNKVEDSQVTEPVEICAQSDNEGLATLAKQVRALHME